jgi:hypothetical protein
MVGAKMVIRTPQRLFSATCHVSVLALGLDPSGFALSEIPQKAPSAQLNHGPRLSVSKLYLSRTIAVAPTG